MKLVHEFIKLYFYNLIILHLQLPIVTNKGKTGKFFLFKFIFPAKQGGNLYLLIKVKFNF